MHRTHRVRDHCASMASRPMSPSTQLKFLLAWGQGRDSPESQSPLSSHLLRSHLTNNPQHDGSVSSSGRRKRSLTYVPVSAWVKDFKDEDDVDGRSMRTAGTGRRSPSAGRFSAAPRSASLVDRVTSVSSRQSLSMPQELMESPAPPRPPPRASRASRQAQRSPPPPLPPPRRAPRPPPRKTLPPPPPSQLKLLRPPMPSQTPPPTPPVQPLIPLPPERVASASASAKASVAAVAVTSQRRAHRHTSNVSQAELQQVLARSASRAGNNQASAGAAQSAGAVLTESSKKHRVLRRPSDVALLLHEILAGRASRSGAGETTEIVAPAAGAASTKSTKSTHGPGAGRAVKNQDESKKQQKWYKKAAKSRSYSSESNIVDTLAEIIAEKITRADRRRQKYDNKGDERPKVTASSTNQSKDKDNGVPGTERKIVKVKRHSKRSSIAADSSLSKQQNCSNCYERPPKRNHTRRLCHTHSLCMQPCTGGNSRSGDGWTAGAKALRWSAESQERRCEWGLSNRSNAGNCQPGDQLFFEGNFEPSQIRATATPVSECNLSERFGIEQTRQHELLDQDDDDTASGTCSTNEETSNARRSNPSLLSTQAVYHQRFSGIKVASVSRSSDLSQMSVSEFRVDSPIAPTTKQTQPIYSAAVTERLSRYEKRARKNMDFESQTAAAAAAYTEDLFSGLLKGRDESDLLLPLEEPPRELRLNWVPADTGNELGGGDCEATINILEPESMLRANRCEGSPVLSATQSCNESSDHPPTSRSDVAEKLQLSQTRSSISSHASQDNNFCLQSVPHIQQNPSDWFNTRQEPCIGGEGFDGVVKTVNKKRATLRRRSRVHVVEPLADAIQHKIELPSCIVEQNFSSWRPLKYAQQLKQSSTFISLENTMPEPASQPVSLFCHYSGSLIKVDNRIPAVPWIRTCRTGSIFFRFARSIASRIVETLRVSCCLLDSTIELAGGKLNLSMLNATHHTEPAIVRSSLCLHQRCGNRQKQIFSDIGQTWPPCCFYWAECCRGAASRRGLSNERLELLRVASNLAVQSQRRRNRTGCDFDEHATGLNDCDSSLSRYSCDISLREPLCPMHYLKRSKPMEASSIERYKRIGTKNSNSRLILTHCPELITNPNLDLASKVEVSDDCRPYTRNDQKAPQYQLPQPSLSNQKTVSSENSSSESSVVTLGNQFSQPSDQCKALSSKAAGDKLASRLDQTSHSLRPDAAVGPLRPQMEAADESAGSSQPDPGFCSSRSFPSSSSCVVTPRLSECEQEAPPMLSITCQLTVVDQDGSDADTSDTVEESLPAGDCA